MEVKERKDSRNNSKKDNKGRNLLLRPSAELLGSLFVFSQTNIDLYAQTSVDSRGEKTEKERMLAEKMWWRGVMRPWRGSLTKYQTCWKECFVELFSS